MTPHLRRILTPALLLLAGCSSSTESSVVEDSSTDPEISEPADPEEPVVLSGLDDAAEASRLLARATFGPTPGEVEAVTTEGFQVWLDAQMELPVTEIFPRLEPLGCFVEVHGVDTCPAFDENIEYLHLSRDEFWWQHVLFAPDQLRQRVAFALSELFVVSIHADAARRYPLMLADYYDTLARGSFGNFRDLLEDVTLHPAMALYLSLVNSRKPDEALGIRPDENYARECMQLFSIGLVMLNPDGSPQLDEEGQSIPTFDQDVILGMARALTGWSYQGAPTGSVDEWLAALPKMGRMEPWEEMHDSEPKLLVNGFLTAGGETAQEDLDLALDLLFEHPNVGPFLGKQLIQRLVTSNPSPGYITRVAAAFDDNGAGVRGDLGAVVRAILTDPEALERPTGDSARVSKLREPILRMTALMRAFGAVMQDDLVNIQFANWAFGQAPLAARTIFNFFTPEFSPAGPIGDADLVSPEMQITTHTYINRTGNVLARIVFDHFQGTACGACPAPLMDYAEVAALAADPIELIDYLDTYLLGGTLSVETREALESYLPSVPLEADDDGLPDGFARVQEALFLLSVSPDFAVQK